MTPEEQRIAIAEACGIQCEPCSCMGGEISRDVTTKKHIPDYLNDLNAMHEAEKMLCRAEKSHNLAGTEWNYYIWKLFEVCTGFAFDHCNDDPHDVVDATSAQRAEAFLKTLGRWK